MILFTFDNHLAVLLVTAELLFRCSVVAGRGWERLQYVNHSLASQPSPFGVLRRLKHYGVYTMPRISSRDLGPSRTLSVHGAEYRCRGLFEHREEIEYRLNIDLRGGIVLAN